MMGGEDSTTTKEPTIDNIPGYIPPQKPYASSIHPNKNQIFGINILATPKGVDVTMNIVL